MADNLAKAEWPTTREELQELRDATRRYVEFWENAQADLLSEICESWNQIQQKVAVGPHLHEERPTNTFYEPRIVRLLDDCGQNSLQALLDISERQRLELAHRLADLRSRPALVAEILEANDLNDVSDPLYFAWLVLTLESNSKLLEPMKSVVETAKRLERDVEERLVWITQGKREGQAECNRSPNGKFQKTVKTKKLADTVLLELMRGATERDIEKKVGVKRSTFNEWTEVKKYKELLKRGQEPTFETLRGYKDSDGNLVRQRQVAQIGNLRYPQAAHIHKSPLPMFPSLKLSAVVLDAYYDDGDDDR